VGTVHMRVADYDVLHGSSPRVWGQYYILVIFFLSAPHIHIWGLLDPPCNLLLHKIWYIRSGDKL